MAGFAKTDKFMFSTATLCVGPRTSLLTLNPAEHSLGLVKEVRVTAEPSIVDLTQGVINDLVDSQINGMNITIGANVHEYTARNLAYGLSLDGSNVKYDQVIQTFWAPAAAVSAAVTTLTIATDVTSNFPAGSWGFLQEGTDDYIHLFKVASSNYSAPDTTVTFTGYAVPTGMTFSTANGRVGRITKIDFDPTAVSNFYACRIIGTQKNDKRPFSLVFPKVRITKGFNVSFAADNFGSLPFEFQPFTPLASDSGYSADFPNRMHVIV